MLTLCCLRVRSFRCPPPCFFLITFIAAECFFCFIFLTNTWPHNAHILAKMDSKYLLGSWDIICFQCCQFLENRTCFIPSLPTNFTGGSLYRLPSMTHTHIGRTYKGISMFTGVLELNANTRDTADIIGSKKSKMAASYAIVSEFLDPENWWVYRWNGVAILSIEAAIYFTYFRFGPPYWPPFWILLVKAVPSLQGCYQLGCGMFQNIS